MQQVYEFGPFRVDLRRRVLERDGAPVVLTGKAFEILAALLERRGEIVDKESLMKAVWRDTAVEENNLTVNISWLRKALGETPNDPQYILTIPGRGYRFIGEAPVAPQRRPVGPYFAAAGLLFLLVLSGSLWMKFRPLGRSSAPGNRIAVLPFRVLSSDPANAYLGAGLTDALITRLANLRGVTVRPMSSVLRLTDKDPFAAGREVGADIVLDGKVQQMANNIRVSVQMLRVKDGASMWADTFDENLTTLFALEDSISARVATSLSQNLSGVEQGSIAKRNTRNADAYQNYLRGRYYASRYTEEGYRKGLDYLQKAIAADPGYALAYSGLADCYYDASNMLLPPQEAMVKAKAAGRKAAELDPALADAHVSLGIVASKFDWDWPTAESEFQAALRLNPNLSSAHLWYGLYLAERGDLERAVSEVRRAQELDPLSTDSSSYLASVLYWSRNNPAAMDQVQKTLDFDSAYFPAQITKAWILEAEGRPLEAVAVCEKAKSLADTSWTAAALGRALALAGKRDEAKQALEQLKQRSEREFVPGYDVATIYAALGQRDEAFAELQKAYNQRAEWLGYLKVDPQLDTLRSDPRFRDLLRRLALDR
ncbi:MAG TPA: winged helix-turn-helix domain-containing protein [Bryobacteraceae bacterium]|nr:winged helix-turn-helix domain-containing protein [Bryobacteraceae bacterium]